MKILSDSFTKIKNKYIFQAITFLLQFYELEYISSIFLYASSFIIKKSRMTQTCPGNDLESRVLSSLRLTSKSIITHNDSQRDEKTSILQEPSIDWVGLTGRMNMNPSSFLADPHLCEWVQDQELIKIQVWSLPGSLWSCSHQTPLCDKYSISKRNWTWNKWPFSLSLKSWPDNNPPFFFVLLNEICSLVHTELFLSASLLYETTVVAYMKFNLPLVLQQCVWLGLNIVIYDLRWLHTDRLIIKGYSSV